MAYLGTEDLKKLFRASKCIEPYREERVRNASYELSLGDQVYLTDSSSKTKDILKDNSQVNIEPGQFALLLTEEIVRIPRKMIGFISIKFGEKKKGLINVSGFHVDPGFEGKIKFSVYNAGPSTIVLDKGGCYFVLWLSELTSEAEEYKGGHQNQNEINANDVASLKGEVASPNSLLNLIKKLESDTKISLQELSGKKDRNDWLLKFLIGIVILMGTKNLWEMYEFKTGFKTGLEHQKQFEEFKLSLLKQNDSLVNKRIDSIILSGNNNHVDSGKK